ncbi:hypothetical protein AA21291_2421 [Swaminathania salitolerans LMG 21291]|nr:hypothetical protein AA21291_2421 [Swaminathania salitolerans LMG 21291]
MRAAELRLTARRYGGIAIGVALVALIGVGGWQWQVHARHQAQARASGQYFTAMEALQAEQPDAALRARTEKESIATLTALAADAPGATRSFAALRLAQLLAGKGDVAGARKAWQGVIDNPDADPTLHSLAQALSLNSHVDDKDPAGLRAGYEQLSGRGGPWRAFAQEGLAMLDLRSDATAAQHEEARKILIQLSQSPDAPDGMRQRVSILLQTFDGAG